MFYYNKEFPLIFISTLNNNVSFSKELLSVSEQGIFLLKVNYEENESNNDIVEHVLNKYSSFNEENYSIDFIELEEYIYRMSNIRVGYSLSDMNDTNKSRYLLDLNTTVLGNFTRKDEKSRINTMINLDIKEKAFIDYYNKKKLSTYQSAKNNQIEESLLNSRDKEDIQSNVGLNSINIENLTNENHKNDDL